MADEVLLSSLRVMPERLREMGFYFHDTELKQTLEAGLSRETANEGG
jgi:NAD dependent epimerase/dehydratase family enzyme